MKKKKTDNFFITFSYFSIYILYPKDVFYMIDLF